MLVRSEPIDKVETMKATTQRRYLHGLLCAAALISAPLLSGCQVSIAGQTLPSAYYLQDDTQYFPKGHEFKLYREAAALREAQTAQPGVR
jgi:hypothetical protein